MMRRRANESNRNKRGICRRFLTGLLLSTAVSMLLCGAVSAQKVIDTPKGCSINLQLGYTDSKTNKKVSLTGGEVTVYKVSDALEDNGDRYYDPKTSGQFQTLANKATQDGRKIAAIRTISSEELTKQNASLAKILNANRSGIKGATAKISKGSVTVGSLTPGLYLMVMTKTSPEKASFAPFLFTLPDPQGSYQIKASPKPSVTKTETETKKTPTEKTSTRLPQTGQLWWPVPVLILAGLLLVILGWTCKRKARE